ncbi:MAG: type II toxin-antitoxin system RelE/ParE family toxin [Thermoanaerobaculia bacterium]
MIEQVTFAPRAARQTWRALEWWNQNRPEAPTLLEQEISAAVEMLRRHPSIGQVVHGRRSGQVQRLILRHTGYWLYYQITPHGVEIVALWHHSRGREPRL